MEWPGAQDAQEAGRHVEACLMVFMALLHMSKTLGRGELFSELFDKGDTPMHFSTVILVIVTLELFARHAIKHEVSSAGTTLNLIAGFPFMSLEPCPRPIFELLPS